MRFLRTAPWFVLALLAVGGLALERLQAAPITWMGGDGNWDASDANWNPADEPDADDEAIISTPDVVTLTNPVETIAVLTMSDGAALVTNGNSLQISGSAQLTGQDTTLAVSENSHVSVGDMAINSGAQLYMQGGVVESSGGGMIATDATGNIYGYGVINAPVNNSGAITAAGGTLTLANPTFKSNAASNELRVEPNSMLEIRGNTGGFNYFNGLVTIDSGTLFMNQAPGGSAGYSYANYDLTGGTLMQSAGFNWPLGGLFTVRAGAPSTLKGPGTFTLGLGATIQLDADLRLDADARTISGGTWKGTGDVVVMPGRQLVVAGEIPRVRNEGSFVVSTDQGTLYATVDLRFFKQTSTGKLVLDVARDHGDQLIVDRAELAGDLDLRINYTPQIGETFKALDTGSYVGTFDHVIQPDSMPPDLMYSVVYDQYDVFVTVVPRQFLSADFNHDGQVDGADLSVWTSSAGQNGSADANGDGDSDGADLLAWQRQVGLSGGTGAASVPEPAAFVVAALAGLALPIRPRRLC